MRLNNFKIHWKYMDCTEQKIQNNKPTEITKKCTEAILEEFKDGEYKEVGLVKISCYHKDKYDKKVARKESFRRLIASFDKNQRAAFWDQYRKEIKN